MIEGQGISTVSITMRPDVTEHVRVPRAAYLRFPLGNPVGRPFHADQQRQILMDVLNSLRTLTTPGQMVELAHRWREKKPVSARDRHEYVEFIGDRYEALAHTAEAYYEHLEMLLKKEQARESPNPMYVRILEVNLRHVGVLIEIMQTGMLERVIDLRSLVYHIGKAEKGELV